MSFYDDNGEDFIKATYHVDMTSLYASFLPHIRKGGRILDAGCGSGRDSRAFIEKGFSVRAFDASPTMAKYATRHVGIDVAVLDFSDFAAKSQFDGVWACASLLHVRRACLPRVVQSLAESMVVGGVFYASFKLGSGERIVEGRHFTDLTLAGAGELMTRAGLSALRIWVTGDLRGGRESERWVNMIARQTG